MDDVRTTQSDAPTGRPIFAARHWHVRYLIVLSTTPDADGATVVARYNAKGRRTYATVLAKRYGLATADLRRIAAAFHADSA